MKAAKKNTMDMIKRFETLTFTFTFFAIPSLIALIWRSKNVNKIGAYLVIFCTVALYFYFLFLKYTEKTSSKNRLFKFLFSSIIFIAISVINMNIPVVVCFAISCVNCILGLCQILIFVLIK